MSKERRIDKRIPLDDLYFIELEFNDKETINCIILDISTGGLMIEVSAGEKEAIPSIGGKGVVVSISPEFPGLSAHNLGVTVMWINENLCGIAFDALQPKLIQAFESAGRE